MKILLILLVIGLVAAALFAYGKGFFTLPKPSEKLTAERITIAEAQYPSFALVYIADKEGFFKEQGLDVTFKPFALGKDALKDVISGDSDLATVYETPFVRNVYSGEDIRAISSLHKSNSSTALLALKSRNIKKIEDIKGKKIGVIIGTSGEFFLYTLLSGNGIAGSEVTIVPIKSEEMMDILDSENVDAIVTYDPYLFRLKNKYKDNTLAVYSDLYTENSLLVGMSDTIKNRKDAYVRVLKALSKAEEFARKNKAKAVKDVADSLKNSSVEEVGAVWDNYKLTTQMDNVLLAIMGREGQWLNNTDSNFSQKPIPDFRESILTDYLKEVNPDAVTIF